MINKGNDFENVVNSLTFLTNPEIVKITNSPWKIIEPYTIEIYKGENDFDDVIMIYSQ